MLVPGSSTKIITVCVPIYKYFYTSSENINFIFYQDLSVQRVRRRCSIQVSVSIFTVEFVMYPMQQVWVIL